MIELTNEQRQVMGQMGRQPLRFIDPESRTTFVLVPAEFYQKLLENYYDASPWTAEEMDALAAERAEHLGWDDMEVYQDYKP